MPRAQQEGQAFSQAKRTARALLIAPLFFIL